MEILKCIIRTNLIHLTLIDIRQCGDNGWRLRNRHSSQSRSRKECAKFEFN